MDRMKAFNNFYGVDPIEDPVQLPEEEDDQVTTNCDDEDDQE
jgi:hypothetical protein